MKTTKIALTLFLAVSMVAQAQTVASQLLTRLQGLAEKGIMFGHQDSPFYGYEWSNIGKEGVAYPDRNDVKDVCGDLPAVMGFDLGGLEYFSLRNIDGVPFELQREEILKHHRRGGIVTLSWHPINPGTNKDAWQKTDNVVVRVLPGGDLNAKFNTWLDELVKYFRSLKGDDGQLIPFIFRPWHEMNGDWFWWGKGNCSPEEYKQLFRYTYHYIQAQGDFQNIVWAYSPNGVSADTEAGYMTYYPGDFIQILGIDYYQYSPTEQYVKDLRNECEIMRTIAQRTGQLTALTEFGFRNCNEKDWFTKALCEAIKGFGLSHALTWRNAQGQKAEAFGPYPGKLEAPDFKKAVTQKKLLMLNDIK